MRKGNIMKQRTMLVTLAAMMWVSSSFASLLNVTLTFPKISCNNALAFALNYTPTNQLLSISATPTTMLFANAEPPRLISGTKSLQIQIMVDNTGTLVGSAPGDGGNDLVLSGTVTEGTNTYSGVLLTGTVTGFGFLGPEPPLCMISDLRPQVARLPVYSVETSAFRLQAETRRSTMISRQISMVRPKLLPAPRIPRLQRLFVRKTSRPNAIIPTDWPGRMSVIPRRW